MNNQSYVNELIEKARMAMQEIQNYRQEEIDKLVRGIGKIAFENAETLAEIAVAETGYGRAESKGIKNRRTAMAAWHYLKDKKSVGIIEYEPEKCLVTMAKPAGVIACITPTTNPSATIVVNCMHVLKGKNAAIIAPHPKSKKASKMTAELLRCEIAKLGGPADLIQIVEEPSTEISQLLMASADAVVATGGAGMVKAAYSSGKPSFGVGQGNVQVVVDEDYEDYETIATNTVGNRLYDNGMPCTGEQAIFVSQRQFPELVRTFEQHRTHYIEDPAQVQQCREKIFNEKGVMDSRIFGQNAEKVAEILGFEVPEGTEIIMLKVEKLAKEEILAKEILCPILKIYTYERFEDAVEGAKKNLLMEGAGHSAVIYSNDPKRVDYFAGEMPVCRVDVNTSAVAGSGSPYDSGIEPTMSNGCGFWGGNSISGSLTYKHLLNYTKIIRKIPDVIPPSPEEVWG